MILFLEKKIIQNSNKVTSEIDGIQAVRRFVRRMETPKPGKGHKQFYIIISYLTYLRV